MSKLRLEAAEALRKMSNRDAPVAKPGHKETVTFSDISFDVDEDTKQRADIARESVNRKLGLTE